MTAAWPTADEVALQHLEADWSGGYDRIRFEGGKYRATFRYGDKTELVADTPAGLESAMAGHWTRTWRGGFAGVPSAPWDVA